ncbi:MAG: NAD(P)H-hydrate dehydratase, partial [Candidatus Kapaibacterium sp.]
MAIDIPTGLDGNTGIAYISTFNADYTYTMYAEKTGLLLNDGKDYSGKVEVLDLGIPKSIINTYSKIYKYDKIKFLKRKNNTSKFNYGKSLVVAGSESMSGAASLTCNAAISAGAGLVYLITTEKHNCLYSEIITTKVSEYSSTILNNKEIQILIEKSDSIVIGPGLGKSIEINEMINSLIEKYPNKKYIIDADGISALDNNKLYNQNITITPHNGEFANLIGKKRLEIIDNLVDLVKDTAKKMKVNILLKGATSIISDGEEVILISDGGPELATAGSGDVLSGILGAQINHNLSQENVY